MGFSLAGANRVTPQIAFVHSACLRYTIRMILEEIGSLPDYELLDSGEGYRLERFGEFVLARPDPAALWQRDLPQSEWQKADAIFRHAAGAGNGKWVLKKAIPERWLMRYGSGPAEISFYAKLTPFKHTGIFSEQAANWDFVVSQAKKIYASKAAEPSGSEPSAASAGFKVLSLFGYTGIASVLCAKLGWQVTHADASRPAILWAKENMVASGLEQDSIRWILDDALKFVKREHRRGVKYNAIIMDPPAFGRGSKGEVWKFGEDLPKLFSALRGIAAAPEDFGFFIVNAYAVSAPSLLLKNLLDDFSAGIGLKPGAAEIDYGELVLRQKSNPNRLLSTGNFARMRRK